MQKLIQFILCTAILCFAQSAKAAQQWEVSPQASKIEFLIHSTLHDATGKARELSGSFDQEQNLAKGFIDVNVLGLTTANEKRDQNMYQMFEVAKSKIIHFSFDGTDIEHVMDHHDGQITFSGTLTIHNVSRPVTLISKASASGNDLICDGNLLIHLKDYELKPPSVMGLIRVKDDVHIQYTIHFTKKGTTP